MVATSLGGCEVVTSFDSACEKRLPPTSVSVIAAPLEYKTDFSLSSAELTAKGAPAAGSITLGYIETQLSARLAASGSGMVQPVTRRFCVRPQLQVSLAFTPTTLYVAREHPEGTCEFRIVMDHELRHFREYERFLPELAHGLEQDLQASFGDRVMHAQSTAAGEKLLQERVSSFLGPRVEAARVRIAERQARFDTPEEYFRLNTFRDACAPGPGQG
jgi:hypothetical protein